MMSIAVTDGKMRECRCGSFTHGGYITEQHIGKSTVRSFLCDNCAKAYRYAEAFDKLHIFMLLAAGTILDIAIYSMYKTIIASGLQAMAVFPRPYAIAILVIAEVMLLIGLLLPQLWRLPFAADCRGRYIEIVAEKYLGFGSCMLLFSEALLWTPILLR